MGRNLLMWREIALAAAVMLAAGGSAVGVSGVARGDGAGQEAAGTSSERAAKAEWGKISNEIKSQEDLQTIVGMHDRFLTAYADSSLALSVSNSRDVYAALLQADAKKFRGKWLPAAQIEVMEKTWRDEVRPALSLYEAGKFKEATEAARQVERSDKDNAIAWAIDGDSAYHLKLPTAARGVFEKLAALDQENVLAQNNLAVLAFENKQIVLGMMHYTKALQHGSENAVLLNNVAEALHTYLTSGGAGGTAGDKNNATYKELASKAAGAEARMISIMEKQGVVRRGALWVTQAQQEKILQEINAIKYQMAMLDKQYADVQEQAAAAQRGLAEAQAAHQRAQNRLTVIDSSFNGRGESFLRAPVAKEVSRLEARQVECQEILARLSQVLPDFKAAAEKLKAQMAATDQKYTGVQKILEPESSKAAAAMVASALPAAAPAQASAPSTVAAVASAAAAPGVTGVPAGASTQPAADLVASESRPNGGTEYESVPLIPQPPPSYGVPSPSYEVPSQVIPQMPYPAFYGGPVSLPLYFVRHDGPSESDYLPLLIHIPYVTPLKPLYPGTPGPVFPIHRPDFPFQPVPMGLSGERWPGVERNMVPQFDPGSVLGPMVPRLGPMVPTSGSMTPGGGSMTPTGGSMTPRGGASMTPRGGASMTPKAAR